MNGLFLDTAGWFAAISPREKGHDLANRTYADAVRQGLRLVTTPLVIAEMHSLMLRWRDPATAARFLDIAFDTETHEVVSIDDDLIGDAVERWIQRYSDQAFSLCDAVSFEVMRQMRLVWCLTYDRHFATAGYRVLR